MKKLRSERKHDAVLSASARYCSVAAAVIGTAVVGGLMAPDAPDNSGAINASAQSSERVGMRQLDLQEKNDAAQKIRTDKLDALQEKVSGAQLTSMATNDALSKEYADYQRTTFRPLEQGIVDDAKKFDSPEEQERVAGAASAAVKQNVTQATEANTRSMARMGVNPSSGRSMVTQNETAITGALGEAGAENTARQTVKTLGAAKRMDAASLGRGLASSQATSAGVALNAGNSAVNNAAQGINSANGVAQTNTGILSGANASFGTATNGLIGAQSASMGVYNAQKTANDKLMGGIGKGVGMWAGAK